MSRRHHCPPPTSRRICCDMRLNGNLIEEQTGVDCYQMYDLANFKDRNVVIFEMVYVTDPADATRQCLKRTTSSNMRSMYSPIRMPNVLEPNENTPTIYKCYYSTQTTNYYYTNLIDKTLEFSYYPNQVNGNYKMILNELDSYAGGPVSGAKGIDFLQYNNQFKLRTYSTTLNGSYVTLATNIVANKWYRFKIESIDIGNEEFYYRISVFDNGTLIGYQDETTLGIFYHGSRQTNNRYLTFFNTHYNYYYGYSSIANTTAYLKDILIYYNE